MLEVRVDLEELKTALGELEARGKPGDKVRVEIKDRQLILSCNDRSENGLEAILYNDKGLGAQFRMTHRLMFMKDKKRV